METLTRAVPVLLLLLTACGGGGSGDSAGDSSGALPSINYTVGGTVAGLTGSGLVLRNNGGDDLAISGDGAFVFPTSLASGNDYDVTVAVHPTGPAQSCAVTNAGGTVSGAVTNVEVNCFPLQSIVYARHAGGAQDDLHLIKEDGSEFVTLADSTDGEYFRTLTPDGKIIYERGLGVTADVYIVNADGTDSILLADDGDIRADIPTVTSTGRVLLTRFSDLHSVNTDGTGLVSFGGSAGTEGFDGFTPGGQVIYHRFDTSQSDNYALYRCDADGNNEIQISPINTTEFEQVAAITPGGRVVFQRAATITGPRDLYSVNEDGTGFVTLANEALSDEFVALIANERVVYHRPSQPLGLGGEIYSVRADGTGGATLTNSPDEEFFAGATPDGKVILRRQVSDPLTGGTQDDLYLINGDGTGRVTLAATADHESFFGVTPDGRILFARYSAGQSDLYLVGADGTGEIRLTDTPESESVDCSIGCITPTGRVVFTRRPATGGQADIYSINLDGTGERVLADSPDNEFAKAITASSRVIFVRATGAQNDLYSIYADGTGLRTLADTLDSETFSTLVAP